MKIAFKMKLKPGCREEYKKKTCCHMAGAGSFAEEKGSL